MIQIIPLNKYELTTKNTENQESRIFVFFVVNPNQRSPREICKAVISQGKSVVNSCIFLQFHRENVTKGMDLLRFSLLRGRAREVPRCFEACFAGWASFSPARFPKALLSLRTFGLSWIYRAIAARPLCGSPAPL